MPINKSDKTELLEKLNALLKRQSLFQQEINDLQLQITQLKTEEPKAEPARQVNEIQPEKQKPKEFIKPKQIKKGPSTLDRLWNKTGVGSEIEQFIGTNLINKIGMIVIIIGVGIGAKYAIDNNLVSPVLRIILGYLVGGILSFFAIRLKNNFSNFSAVLISGAMAIHYYITYAAFSYYSLYSSTITFILMVLFTVVTVALALYYKQQVIAHFGLVGAYLVPFLVGDPDSNVMVLFTYMAIINSGILFISTKKRWKPLNYLAFVATWVIFMFWFASKEYDNELKTALIFAALFFTIFYSVFLSYKLILKEKLKVDDIFYLLLNAGIFYMVGMIALRINETSNTYAALFTAINALIHAFTAYIIYRTSEKNNLFYWTLGIVIAFVTTAIGLQFNHYLTALLWSIEAALVFWIGRKKDLRTIEYLSFAIICCTFIIAILNWVSISYNFHTQTIDKLFTPIFSLQFLASFVVLSSFSFIYYTSRKYILTGKNSKSWLDIFNLLFPMFFLITLFFTFYNEIDLYWNNIQVYTSYKLNTDGSWVKAFDELNQDIFNFKTIWLINYSILLFCTLAFTNYKWLKNKVLNAFVFVMAGLMVLVFVGSGLDALSTLRNSYLNTNLPDNYAVNSFHLLIRYVAYLFLALLFYSNYKFTIPLFSGVKFAKVFEIVLSVTIVWICSSELINILSLSGSSEVYKHGLSILWGVLSFILIGYGVWKKKKHLRITAILLFAGTILKLFFYDLSHLDTIQKVFVFLVIGTILMTVSYIYNKYKDVIFGNDETRNVQ